MRAFFGGPALALALAACVTRQAEPETVAMPQDASEDDLMKQIGMCDAAPAQARIGDRYDAAMDEALMRASGSTVLRVLRPGDRRSADFLFHRLNVMLDTSGRIVRLTCG